MQLHFNKGGVNVNTLISNALSSYLPLSGGNTTGNLDLGTTITNTKLDVDGKVNITNGSGLNTPQVGLYGGTGYRIVFWITGSTTYPFSLGTNGSTLWYSVPAGSYHKFYYGGTNN